MLNNDRSWALLLKTTIHCIRNKHFESVPDISQKASGKLRIKIQFQEKGGNILSFKQKEENIPTLYPRRFRDAGKAQSGKRWLIYEVKCVWHAQKGKVWEENIYLR